MLLQINTSTRNPRNSSLKKMKKYIILNIGGKYTKQIKFYKKCLNGFVLGWRNL